MEDILTMQVWIPRYTYTVWNYNKSGTVSSNPQEIQIQFEANTNSSGEIACVDDVRGTSDGTANGTEYAYSEICKLKSNNEECTDSLCNGKKYTHPAFTFGTQELTGFWVGKFELSSDTECKYLSNVPVGQGCNLITANPLILPNVKVWTGAMISVHDYNLRKMNDNGNIYGFSLNDDTHGIKNIEWGAVAYLSHSQYGINKEILANINSEFTTGCGVISESDITSSGEVCNSYNTTLGQQSSTTGNVYGIYDMVGSTYDAVMGNMVSIDGTMMTGSRIHYTHKSGYTGIIWNNDNYTYYNDYFEYPEEKYYDKYTFSINNLKRSRSKLGDATKEVYNGSGSLGWYQDRSTLVTPNDNGPWTMRGGLYSSSTSPGVFYANSNGAGFSQGSGALRLTISN